MADYAAGEQTDVGDKRSNGSEQDNLPTQHLMQADVSDTGSTSHISSRSLKSKSITLDLLIRDGIMEPAERSLSIKYLGITVTADLLPNGKIRSIDSGEVFSTPSSWAISCKKSINPTKSSGCGWSSIRYKGKPLDLYKTKWMRETTDSARGSPITPLTPLTPALSSGVSTPKQESSPIVNYRNSSSPMLMDIKPVNPTDLLYPSMTNLPLLEYDKNIKTQVRCEGLEFSVRAVFSRDVCITMAELSNESQNETSGYLAGTYNSLHNVLTVERVYSKSDPEARQKVQQSGMVLVGWFHSHPNRTYYPSVYDVECHMNYQLRLRDQPIVSCIIGRKHEDDPGSLSMLCYTVSPPKLKFSERFGCISDKCGKPKLVPWKLQPSDSAQPSRKWLLTYLSNIANEIR